MNNSNDKEKKKNTLIGAIVIVLVAFALVYGIVGLKKPEQAGVNEEKSEQKYLPHEGEIAGEEELALWTKINDVSRTVEKDGQEHILYYYKYTSEKKQYTFYVDEETKQISDVNEISLKKVPESERLDPKKNYGEINYEKNKHSYNSYIHPNASSSDKKESNKKNNKINSTNDYNLSEDFNDWAADEFADEMEAEEYWDEYYDYEENGGDMDEWE